MMNQELLISVLNRIIPAEENSPGGEIALNHVLSQFSIPHADWEAFTESLGRFFIMLSPEEQDAILHQHEKTPLFRSLCEWTHEGYWTSEAGQELVGFVVTG
jgi:hypothetical protein